MNTATHVPTMLIVALATGLWFGLVDSIASPRFSDDAPAVGSEAYIDPASQIHFPINVGPFKRLSIQRDMPIAGAAHIKYLASDRAEALGMMQTLYAIQVDVRVICAPASKAPALASLYLQEYQKHDSTYRPAVFQGNSTFGNQIASCGECTLDIPAYNDRGIVEIIAVSHNRYLIGFCFAFSASRQRKWQPEIDSFVRRILGIAKDRAIPTS